MSSAFPPNNPLRQLRNITRPVLDIDYNPYSPPDSPVHDDDENASLRSQALNADGTPKRPMNAFMIFARRRRPQVSAANQMMRTGEISKILSREWNTMPLSDKQFYLDQAKKLKEHFNAKYPDYVYRRRPNNSRKKRRTDAAPYDPAISHHVHDYDPPHDDSPFGSVSPIDPHPHHGLVQHPDMLSNAYRIPSGPPPPGPYTGTYHPDSSYPYYTHQRLPPVYDTPASAPAAPTLSLSTASFGPPHHHHHHHAAASSSSGGGTSASHHHGSGAQLYSPVDDHLWHPTSASSGAAAYPPVKAEPWTHPHPHHQSHLFSDPAGTGPALPPPQPPTLRLSTRRGAGPLPLPLPSPLSHGPHGHGHGGHGHTLPLLAHARHWSDSTTATTTTGASSASPPSSAGSGSAGSAGSGAGFGGHSPGGFQTLTAPFYPGSAGSAPGSVSGGSVSGAASAATTTASGGSLAGMGMGMGAGMGGAGLGAGMGMGAGLGLGLGAGAGAGPVSPSTASASSASSYFSAPDREREREGAGGGARGYERAHQSQSQAHQSHSQGHQSHPHPHTSHSHNAHPHSSHSQSRSHHASGVGAGGPTLGSTLALSPANVQHGSLWGGGGRVKGEL